MIIFLYIWLVISLPIVILMGYYLYKFARIILLFEEDISKTIESLEDVEESMAGVIELKMFFDDEKIKMFVGQVMDNVKLAKAAVNVQAKKLIEKSKQKYIIIEEVEPTVELEENQTKNHPEERTVLHVGRTE